MSGKGGELAGLRDTGVLISNRFLVD